MGTIKGILIPADESLPIKEVTLEDHGDWYLKAMQEVVGGYIERVVIGDWKTRQRYDNAIMYVNEAGSAQGCAGNIRASILYGHLVHGGVIYGDALISGEEFGYEGPEPADLQEKYSIDFFAEATKVPA